MGASARYSPAGATDLGEVFGAEFGGEVVVVVLAQVACVVGSSRLRASWLFHSPSQCSVRATYADSPIPGRADCYDGTTDVDGDSPDAPWESPLPMLGTHHLMGIPTSHVGHTASPVWRRSRRGLLPAARAETVERLPVPIREFTLRSDSPPTTCREQLAVKECSQLWRPNRGPTLGGRQPADLGHNCRTEKRAI